MPNNSSEYYSYNHTDSSISTLNELINGETSTISIMRGIEIGILLRYEDQQGVTNLEKIWDKYPLIYKTEENRLNFDKSLSYLKGFKEGLTEKIPNNSSFLTNIYPNTVLSIPFQKLNRDTLIGEGNQIINEEFEAFVGKKLRELQEDTKYYPLSKTDLGQKGNLKQQFPNMTVWLWCRSLTKIPNEDSNFKHDFTYSNIDESYETPSRDFLKRGKKPFKRGDDLDPLEGTIIDLTPFIDALNISVTSSGGTFGFTLPPIISEFHPELGWKIKEGALKTYIYNGEVNYVAEGGYENSKDKENSFYFHNIIGENDLIFIRFETLNNELKERIKDKQYSKIENNFEVPKTELAGKIYDMIGLVDSNSISKDPTSNNVQINIQGRDLIKLLIDDSSFFTPLNFIPNGSYFSNEIDDKRLFNRIDGKLHTLAQVSEKTIEFSLKYLINALSNMGIIPDGKDGGGLFTSYYHQIGGEVSVIKEGENQPSLEFIDERSYQFRLDIESRKRKQQKSNELINRAKEIKEKLGKIRESEKIVNPFASSEISDTFRTLQDFIKGGYDNKALIPTNSKNTITGWNTFKFQDKDVKKDYIPAVFHNYFLQPKKNWLDENGNTLQQAEKQLAIDYNEKCELLKQTKLQFYGEDVEISKPQTEISKALNKKEKTIISFNDILVDARRIAENDVNPKTKKFAVAESTSADAISDNYVIRAIADLERDLATKKYPKLFLHIEPKKYSELSSLQKEVLNDILEYVILNNQEEPLDDYTKELCRGVWQIVKLVIDNEIQDRRLVDNTIGNESGSILNHFKKVCQEPFVELFTDTYKDQFYIIARKPPFTYNKIKEHIDTGLVLNIEKGEISNSSFNFNQGLGYSMYRITPQSAFMGGSDSITWAYLKAIYFPEFADIYGLKFMDQVSSYIPHFPLLKEGTDRGSAYAIEQSILDLQFIIETNMYLPFTREGSLTIFGGDRRIKRGTWIRLVESDEIGYVESVSNNIVKGESIARSTTLTLTRILKEKYLKEYFSLINLNIKESISKSNSYEDWIKDTVENWKVNKNILNFFLRREQFN